MNYGLISTAGRLLVLVNPYEILNISATNAMKRPITLCIVELEFHIVHSLRQKRASCA